MGDKQTEQDATSSCVDVRPCRSHLFLLLCELLDPFVGFLLLLLQSVHDQVEDAL